MRGGTDMIVDERIGGKFSAPLGSRPLLGGAHQRRPDALSSRFRHDVHPSRYATWSVIQSSAYDRIDSSTKPTEAPEDFARSVARGWRS